MQSCELRLSPVTLNLARMEDGNATRDKTVGRMRGRSCAGERSQFALEEESVGKVARDNCDVSISPLSH